MYPITKNIPKPLVKVNGTPMIESVISALNKNGIYNIYIVVGYLREQFEYLKSKYKGITLIENPYYKTCNNISSLYVARNYLGNSFILDGDQVVLNENILNPEVTLSGYCGSWTSDYTNEWLMTANSEGKVVSCSRTGGAEGWKLYSVSRWTKEDGAKLKEYLELEFEKNNNRDIYWDDVVMFCHFNNFNLTVYKIQQNDIVEIDDVEQLIQVDSSYSN